MRASYNESGDDRSDSHEELREVRRYPNRRMYDTRERCYVALDDIGRWIRDGQRVRVLDVKSNQDVTISVLLSLLVERLSSELHGPEGASLLHRWLREGIHADTMNAPATIQQSDEVAPPAISLTTLQSRLEQLERRVQVLERNARRSEV